MWVGLLAAVDLLLLLRKCQWQIRDRKKRWLCAGGVIVVVAHRLSTVLNASQIIVLNHGHVVEVGNHCSLIAKRGAYYQLIKNQLELGN